MNNCRYLLLLAAVLAALRPAGVRGDAAGDQYAVAASHYSHAQWELALSEFRTFVKEFSGNAKVDPAQFYIGESLVQLRRYAEAADQFVALVESQPEEPLYRKATFRAGEANYFATRLDEARVLLERFRQQYANDKLNAYVLAYLGDIALEKQSTPEAEKLYRQCLEQYPEGPLVDDCRFGLARAMQQQGQREPARNLYQALAAKTGTWAAEAQYRLGRDDYAQGNYAAAIESWAVLETKHNTSPLRPQARLGTAQALYQLGRFDEAQAILVPLADATPIGVEARYWLGLSLKGREDWLGAIVALQKAAADGANHPLAPEIAFQLGDVLLRAGKPADAGTQFDRLLSTWPQHGLSDDALLGKLRAALAQQDGKQVDATAGEFQKKFPDSKLLADATRTQARSLIVRQKFTEAAALLEPLVTGAQASTAPESLLDRYLLALALQGLARPEEVLKLLEPVLAHAESGLKADAVRLEAAAKVALKRYAHAIDSLTAYLKTQPTGEGVAQARAELAICYANIKQFDQAREAYAAFLKEAGAAPLLAPISEVLANTALSAGQFDWAAELFGKLIHEGSSPRDAAVGWSGLGWTQFKTGKLTEALESFTTLTEKYPQQPPAAEGALLRAQVLARQQQLPAALDAYRLVVERYASSAQAPQALLAAAQLEEQLQHLDKAIDLYRRLANDFPQLPQRDQVLYNYAWVLRDSGHDAEAEQQFEQLRTEFPKSRYWPDAVYRLSESSLKKEDYARTKKLLADLLEFGPPESILTHGLYLSAQCALAEEHWAEAQAPLQRLLRDFPESPLRLVAEFWLADIDYHLGNYDQAGGQFTALAKKLPKEHEAWMAVVPLRRAQILVHEKQWVEAQTLAEQISKQFPDFEEQYEVDYVLGRCLANSGKFDEARETYHRVIRSQLGGKTETAAMAQWLIGESYFHQKKYEAAIREYLRLEVLYAYPTWQAGALLQAAKCHEALGEWPQASELYARLLKKFPHTSFSDEATHRLQTARRHLPQQK